MKNTQTKALRIPIAIVALLISHAVVATAVFLYKDLDDNSYYAASTAVLLDEITAALAAEETGFLERLEEFEANQPLTYETRGNLLENARAFEAAGRKKRAE